MLLLLSLLAVSPSLFASTCAPLDSGSSYTMNGFAETGLPAHYTLHRREDREDEHGNAVASYVGVVNIAFFEKDGDVNPKLSSVYERRVRRCFNKISPKLRGPGGEYFELRLAQDEPRLPSPKQMRVRINPLWGFRSNSGEWEDHPECALITHEVLHLFGLVDEYVETQHQTSIGKLKYDCRAHGPVSSIMSDQTYAFQSAGINWFGAWLRKMHVRFGRASLLAPAHFKAITTPWCTDSAYYACARNAYLTSARNGGNGCEAGRPAICDTRDAWLR